MQISSFLRQISSIQYRYDERAKLRKSPLVDYEIKQFWVMMKRFSKNQQKEFDQVAICVKIDEFCIENDEFCIT